MDMLTKKTIAWRDEGEHLILAEPIFIGRPDGILEDDGNFYPF